MGELIHHPAFYDYTHVTIRSAHELDALTPIVVSLTVKYYGCNDGYFTVLNMTRFVNLKEFEVGDSSFSYVDTVYLIGLSKLERVMIGVNSFMGGNNNPNSVLRINGTNSLKELKIGRNSFKDYSAFEMESVPSLEVIQIGEYNKESNNFRGASELELKNEIDDMI